MNFPQGPNHLIAQADLLRMPFRPGQFDMVVCLGVAQHTPSPERAMASLAAQVRPGAIYQPGKTVQKYVRDP